MTWFRLYRLWLDAMSRAGHPALSLKTVGLVWYVLRTLPLATRAQWRRRMRACLRCPIYQLGPRTCGRPNTDLGCGCSMPLKALLRGSECWANEQHVCNIKGWL